MRITEVLKGMGNVVIYYPSIARALGNINAAILICQFVFYTNKAPDEEVFLSHNKIKDTTGLTRTQLESARKLLTELGILEVFRKGLPAKNSYKVNWQVLDDLLKKSLIAENQQSSTQDCVKPANTNAGNDGLLFAEDQQTITDSTIVGSVEETFISTEKKYRNKSDYQIFLEKNYGLCMDLFFEFHKTTLNLPPPKIDGSEGKALKSIISYLGGVLGQEEPDRLPAFLKTIFDNWTKLSPFLQKQITFRGLNSYFTQIVNELKTGPAKATGLEALKNHGETIRRSA